MTRILCLWFPNWPIQRAIRCRPEFKGQPVALVTSGPRGSEVTACCGTAAAQGVRPGMPLVEAQSLARELGVAAYEPEADRAALVKCAEACEQFSPRVAIEDAAEPESLLLDISNLEHLWGSEARLAARVKKFFMSRGYKVRVAIAETVGAAWAAARFEGGRQRGEGGGKNLNHEWRMVNVPADFSSFNLPVQSLRIAEETALVLRELGVETVAQLLALPREGLAARFGEDLLLRLDQLTGAGREVIEPRRAPAALEARRAFEEPTGDQAAILYIVQQLVDELSRELSSRDQGAVILLCVLRCVDGPPVALRVGLLQPSANARQLLELLELHLESVRLRSEVDCVELRATVVGRLGERQGELFANRWPIDPHQLAVLVNRLTNRLGYDRVLRAEPRASPIPERAVQWVAVMGQSATKQKQKAKRKRLRTTLRAVRADFGLRNKEGEPAIREFPSAIPLLLYPEPLRIEVVCVSPDGPPQCLWLEGEREPIVSCVGPERIETFWWRGPTVRRDYYRVMIESGIQLWLFRPLSERGWFVHGIYA